MKHGNPQLAPLASLAGDTIRTLLSDPNTPASVRLRAAKLVLESAGEDAPAETAESSQPKIGRNDYCPCGSGLKFKKCCLIKTQPPATSVFDIPQAS